MKKTKSKDHVVLELWMVLVATLTICVACGFSEGTMLSLLLDLP